MPTSGAEKLMKRTRDEDLARVSKAVAKKSSNLAEFNALATPPQTEPAKQMGRPKILIADEGFDTLISVGCTLEECAAYFNCSADTIERYVGERIGITFAEYSRQKLRWRLTSLRATMFAQASKGNMTAAIWLSKQYLGMKDKQEFSQDPNAPLIDSTITRERLRAKLLGVEPVKRKTVPPKKKSKRMTASAV